MARANSKTINDAKCVLCGMVLGFDWDIYPEGAFCSDSAGCRRRAYVQMQAMRVELTDVGGTIEDLSRRLEFYEKIDEPVDDPDPPAVQA